MLDNDYIKNHRRLIAVHLSRQKEFDADPKLIQQMKFMGQLKITSNEIVANESMFGSTIIIKH